MAKYFAIISVLGVLTGIFLFSNYLTSQKTTKSPTVFKPSVGRILELVKPKKQTSVMLAGDIMLGRSVMTRSLDLDDPTYPFKKVADKLKAADVVFANLENPIVTGCPWVDAGLKFCADPRMVAGLLYSGVDVVTLANNHSLNYGQAGLEETKQILTANQILWVGAGNLAVIEKNGVKFGFLGFDYLTHKLTDEDLQLVSSSNSQVDILIVGVHWGNEYTEKPTLIQEQTASRLIERGADVIAGHHPHWIQEIEYLTGKPIYYSLGNFVFDQPWSEATKKGLAVRLTYRGKELVKEETLPVYMKEFAQPQWLGN